MKKKRFSVEQIIGVLKQAQAGAPVAEVIRKAGISEQTFYRWKSKYAGLEVDQVRQMAQLQEENHRLKRLVADLKGDDVVRTLKRIKLQRGVPKVLFCDNGSEFTSQAMGLSQRSEDRLLAARKTDRQRIRRELQRHLPIGMSEHSLVR